VRPNLIASGASNETIRLFDLRQSDKALNNELRPFMQLLCPGLEEVKSDWDGTSMEASKRVVQSQKKQKGQQGLAQIQGLGSYYD